MNILYVLVPVALVLAAVGVYGFVWAVRNGQFDDVYTPALRLIIDDENDPGEGRADETSAPTSPPSESA